MSYVFNRPADFEIVQTTTSWQVGDGGRTPEVWMRIPGRGDQDPHGVDVRRGVQ